MLAQVFDLGGGMLVIDLSALFAGAAIQARILRCVAHTNSFRPHRWPGVWTGSGLQQQSAVRLWDGGTACSRARLNRNAGHSTLHYLQVVSSRVASAFLRPIHSSTQKRHTSPHSPVQSGSEDARRLTLYADPDGLANLLVSHGGCCLRMCAGANRAPVAGDPRPQPIA